jgi:outer membrane protein/protease secretion system outer membrane protein
MAALKNKLPGQSVFCTRLLIGAGLLAACAVARPMDLMQAYDAARQTDAVLLASRSAAEAGRERLPQAKAQLLPNVGASLSRNQKQLESATPGLLGIEQTATSRYGSSNATLSLRQPLYRPFQRALVRQAQAQVNDSDAALLRDEQNLAVRVGSAYFEALLAGDQLELVLMQKSVYTRQLDGARKALAAGSGIRTDVDEAQARLDMVVAQELEARQNLEYTRRQLEVMVSQSPGVLATLDVQKLVLDPLSARQLDDWTARAEQSSPDVVQLKAQLEAAREEVVKSRAGHLPTLDGVLQWTRSESENVLAPKSRYTDTSVGLQLSIPLYSGGAVDSAVRQAIANVNRAEQQLEAARRDLGVRVHKEFRGVTEGVPRIRALEQAVRSADQMVLSSRKSFQAGTRTVLDILNAEQQRMVVLRDLSQARYLYLVSKIRLLALVGAADAAAMSEINSMLKTSNGPK